MKLCEWVYAYSWVRKDPGPITQSLTKESFAGGGHVHRKQNLFIENSNEIL